MAARPSLQLAGEKHPNLAQQGWAIYQHPGEGLQAYCDKEKQWAKNLAFFKFSWGMIHETAFKQTQKIIKTQAS